MRSGVWEVGYGLRGAPPMLRSLAACGAKPDGVLSMHLSNVWLIYQVSEGGKRV